MVAESIAERVGDLAGASDPAAVSLARSVNDLRSAAGSVDFSGLGAEGVDAVMVEVRRAERALASITVRAGRRYRELHETGRSASPDEGLGREGRVGSATARREAARSETAAAIPALGDLLDRGEVGPEHLDAVTRHAKRLSDEERIVLFSEDEGLAERAAAMPTDSFEALVRKKVREIKKDHGLGDAEARRRRSELRWWFDKGSGMGRINGSLDPERFEIVVGSIEAEMRTLAATSPEPVTKNHNLAATALVELLDRKGPGRSGRANVTLVVDEPTARLGPHAESIRQTAGGHDLPPEGIDRLCCDAVIRRIVVDERGVPIRVGRKHRTATEAQWAVLRALYTTCGWHGCDRPIDWCQAHHVREWEAGGPTDLDNLVPLCSTHHHRVHEGKWRIRLLADRTLRIWRPDGIQVPHARPDRLEEWLVSRGVARGPSDVRQVCSLPPGRRRISAN